MKVDAQKLKIALNAVKPAAMGKSVIEQMTHFIFTEDAVTTYNDQICTSYPIDTGLKCTVKADSLHRLANRLTLDTIKMTQKDGLLIVKGQGVEAELPMLVEDEIYNLVSGVQKGVKDQKWQKVPEGMMEALGFCMFAASKNATQAAAMCVGVKGKDVMAADGVRFSWCELKDTTRKNFMINAESVAQLIRFGGFHQFCVSDAWVHFKTKDKAVFHVRRNKGDYPMAKGKKLFAEFVGVQVKLSPEDRESINEAVATASVLSEETPIDKTVEVLIEKNRVICKGESEHGKVSRRKKIKYEGDELSFLINPAFFTQILGRDEPSKLFKDDGKVELQSPGFRHIIALKRHL